MWYACVAKHGKEYQWCEWTNSSFHLNTKIRGFIYLLPPSMPMQENDIPWPSYVTDSILWHCLRTNGEPITLPDCPHTRTKWFMYVSEVADSCKSDSRFNVSDFGYSCLKDCLFSEESKPGKRSSPKLSLLTSGRRSAGPGLYNFSGRCDAWAVGWGGNVEESEKLKKIHMDIGH